MKYPHLFFFTIFIFAMAVAPTALAQSGSVSDSARLRSAPNTAGTQILRVVPPGTNVSILEESGGWYRVSVSGQSGWMSATLVKKSATNATEEESAEDGTGEYTVSGRLRSGPGTSYSSIITVPKGVRVRIVASGNGWYKVEYNGKQGWSAASVLKKISNEVPAVVKEKAVAPETAEKNTTQAPSSLTLPDKNLPVTNAPKEAPSPKVYGNAPTTPLDPGNIHRSSVQAGEMPASIDFVALNTYWLEKVNALRAERGLRQLVLDQRWVDSATEYAATIGEKSKLTHDRPNGKTMHQWINGKGLQFMARGSKDGWKTNYFTENLSRGVSDGTMESTQALLDQALDYFLNEGESGAHYKTIYHEDWNSTGLGFYFKLRADGQFDVYVVYHYGSLQM